MAAQPIVPPFSREDAIAKVRGAEDLWNTRDPARVALAYSEDSWWRNRTMWVKGRDEIIAFLLQKWEREIDYRLIKEMWAYGDNRMPSASHRSRWARMDSGIAPTATRTGSSMRRVGASSDTRASTTCRSRRRTGSIGGTRRARALRTTRA